MIVVSILHGLHISILLPQGIHQIAHFEITGHPREIGPDGFLVDFPSNYIGVQPGIQLTHILVQIPEVLGLGLMEAPASGRDPHLLGDPLSS